MSQYLSHFDKEIANIISVDNVPRKKNKIKTDNGYARELGLQIKKIAVGKTFRFAFCPEKKLPVTHYSEETEKMKPKNCFLRKKLASDMKNYEFFFISTLYFFAKRGLSRNDFSKIT